MQALFTTQQAPGSTTTLVVEAIGKPNDLLISLTVGERHFMDNENEGTSLHFPLSRYEAQQLVGVLQAMIG